MANVGTDKRGWVCRSRMTLPKPDGEAALEDMLPSCPWRPQSSPLGTCRGNASDARDTRSWEVGWSVSFLTGDAILKERNGRKWVVRKKIPGRNGEEDAGAV